MVSVFHVVVWIQVLAAAYTQTPPSSEWQEFWEWSETVPACIRDEHTEETIDDVDTLEECKLSCVRATDFLCLSVTYNPAEANGQCGLNRVTSDTVVPTSDFKKPCERDPDNIQYAGRRVKGFLEWTDPVYACIRGNNQRIIGNVVTIEECQQRCVDATGYWCLSIDYNTGNNQCFLNRVNSHTVIPSSDFTQPCYNHKDDVLYAERRIEGFLEWTDPVYACIRGNNQRDISNVFTIDECQQRCVDATKYWCLSIDYNTESNRCFFNRVNSHTVIPSRDFTQSCYEHPDVVLYAERINEVPTTTVTTTMTTELASAMSPVESSDKSGLLPTSELPSQSGSDQLERGSPTPVWIYILVPVGAGVLISILVAVILLRNRRRKPAEGDDSKTAINANNVGAPSNGSTHASGKDAVSNPAYQLSTHDGLGEIYNAAYQSVDDLGSRSVDPPSAPWTSTYEDVHTAAHSSEPDERSRDIKSGTTSNGGNSTYPPKENLHAMPDKKSESESAHDYAYADTEPNTMASSVDDEIQKGQVYNVAYQSVDSPGVPEDGMKDGDAYCYVASPRPTAPPGGNAKEAAADTAYATPEGAAPSSPKGNMESDEVYNPAYQSVGQPTSGEADPAPKYMTVLD